MFGSVRRESRLYHLHLDFRWRQTVEPFGVLLLVFGGSFFVFNMARGKQTFWNFLLFILLITLCKGSATKKHATDVTTETSIEESSDIERIIKDFLKQSEDVTGKTTSVQSITKDYVKKYEDVTGKTTPVEISNTEDDSDTYFDETEKSIIKERRIQDATKSPEDSTEASKYEETTDKQEEDVEVITSGVERQIANQMSSIMTTTTAAPSEKEKILMMVEDLESNNQMNLIIICSVLGSGFLIVIAILLCIARSLSKLSREKDQLSEAEQGNL
ncbi:uncharacterized protein LOC108648126 isoform X1 [Xenopus tropicalis]|uniref:Uncharacterized protein LOC108648126 isoform X1 n=1 Tax=Xenopus tropicalis TaxID=8364 RepID=A0A8J1JWE3_XENTR|nr:uncharacterized protein LOC108648126 isoform X1 [Xenopus tropicalis]